MKGDPQNLKEVHQCLKDVLTALKGMHGKDRVHHDIKIANVLICLDSTWMLIDFDLAAKMDSHSQAEWPFWILDDSPIQRKENEGWKPKHDMKQVAIILEKIESLKKEVSITAQDLVNSISHS